MSIKSTIKSHVKVIIPLTVLVVGLGLLSLFILNNRPSADVAVTPPVISGTITYADGPAVPAGVKVDLTLAGKKNGKKYTKTLTDATDANGAYGFPKSSVDGLKFDKTATINAKVSSSNRKPKCTFTGDPFVVSASGTYTDKDYPCKQSDPNTSGGGGTPPGSDTTSVKPPNTWTNVSDENNGSFTNVFDYQNNEGIINNDKYYSFCETDLNSQVRAYNIKT